MGAKAYLLVIPALAAIGCASGLKRLAPPGIIKYEDLAKDQPPSPVIAQRLKERRAEPGRGFPNLSAQPTTLPEGIAKPERDAMRDALLNQRDALNAAMAIDRAAAEGEREISLEAEREALIEAAEQDEDSASRERGRPIRGQAPIQE